MHRFDHCAHPYLKENKTSDMDVALKGISGTESVRPTDRIENWIGNFCDTEYASNICSCGMFKDQSNLVNDI